MPATYRFDPANRLVYSRAWGVLTGAEIHEHSRRLPLDPRFDPGMRQLQDYADVTAFAVTSEDLRLAAALNEWGAGARRAAVVPKALPFSMARQYELQRIAPGDEYRVFRDRDGALDWLGLPAGWAPPPPSPDDPVFEFPPPGD